MVICGSQVLSTVLRCCLRETRGGAQSPAMTAISMNGLSVQAAREAGKCYCKASFFCPVVSFSK